MGMLRWISIFVGAVSLFSMLERFMNLGLSPHLDSMLNFYRSALYPVAEKLVGYLKLLLGTYHISVPPLPMDAVILYVIFSLAIARYTYNQQEALKKQFGSVPVALIMLPLATIWPLLMIGNIVALALSPKLGISNLLFGWDTELARVIGGCLALFGANAYLLN